MMNRMQVKSKLATIFSDARVTLKAGVLDQLTDAVQQHPEAMLLLQKGEDVMQFAAQEMRAMVIKNLRAGRVLRGVIKT